MCYVELLMKGKHQVEHKFKMEAKQQMYKIDEIVASV